MIVPAVDHRDELGVELERQAERGEDGVHRGGVDEVAEEPEDRPEVLEVEDPEERVDDDHQHEAGVAEDHRGAVGDVADRLAVLRDAAGPGRAKIVGRNIRAQ